ncbi:TonB-dependent siderophore receptor [Thalassospira australica]|uniref:TonB-dependent siderophore receptor n=1 Tax=Thalassospira australica TaxID=1528106 RepID=UPI00138DD9DB|nr:TonB-dependent siderophore receptor [Thalassospira australica]
MQVRQAGEAGLIKGLTLGLARGVSLAALAAGLVVAGVTTNAKAQQQSTSESGAAVFEFSIPSQDLNQALLTFADQTNLQLFYDVDRVAGLKSSALTGTHTPDDALRILLSGSGVTYRFTGESTVSLSKLELSDGDSATITDPVYVEASSQEMDDLAHGYVATRSSAGTKTSTPLVETAKSISVVSGQEMEDRAVASVEDAVAYTAGVATNNYGYDPRFDQVYVRGYPVHIYGDYRDGLRQMTGVYATFRTEPYSLEQLEIVKGPTAALYGQTTPGGLLNSVTKRPRKDADNNVYARFTNTESYEGGFDYNLGLGENDEWASRFVGMARYGETSNDIQDDRQMFAPTIRWQPNTDTDLTVYTLFQHDETDASATLLNLNGEILDYRTSDADYDYQKQDQFQVGYDLTHDLSNVPVTLAQKARFGYFDLEARYLTGGVVGGGWNAADTEYRRVAQAVQETLWSAQVDNQVITTFETDDAKHEILTGLDLMYSKSDYRSGSSAVLSDYTFYLSDPYRSISGTTPAYTTFDDVTYNQSGIYVQDQIELGNWHLNGGVRFDYAERKRISRLTNTGSTDYNTATTFNVSALYAFDNGISPYVSWGTSFLPSTSQDSEGKMLTPTEGEQYEAGIKFEPVGFDGFFTVSAYRLTEDNVARYAGERASGGSYYDSIGKVESRGLEIEGSANVSENLSLVGNLAYNNAKIVKGSYRGNTPLVTPEKAASSWANYNFNQGPLDGWGFGVGVRYTDSSYANYTNTSKNKPYTLLDAAIRYDFAALSNKLDGLTLAINGTNLADNDAAICNNGYCYQIEGQTIAATLKYDW